MNFNPLAPLRWAFSFPSLVPLICAFLLFALIGEVGGTIWVLYGQGRFGWTTFVVGISLAGFGLFHALAQAFVVGPLSEHFGERRAMLVGIVADGAAYIFIALATAGWMGFALLPLFCLGGVAVPALQSLMSAQVDQEHQGRLQGVLASLNGLATVIGPPLISTVYFATRKTVPGAVWFAGAALYAFCVPLVLIRVRSLRRSTLSSRRPKR